MKKHLFSLLTFIFTILQVGAQSNDALVIGGPQKGDANATLEVISKNGTKGFMPPRLTTAQITALNTNLTAVSKGLTVFNTDTNCLQFWKGDKWSDCSTYSNAELTFDCTASTIKGIYNVDKTAGDSEFMEVKVNVTKGGPLVLYSDNQNGIRFYLSTILDIGTHTIEVPAIGTPKAAGDFTYKLFDQSANPICVGNPNFKTTVVENNAAYTINCSQSSFIGTILEGSSANGQTLKLKIETSKSGNYYIKTNTVHGLWFEGSGILNLGTTEIVLDLKGSVDTVPGDGKIAFNFFDKNDKSLAQCSVSIYVSAEKASYFVDDASAIYSGGIGIGTGGSFSVGARLFYVGYVYNESDYIKVRVTVDRPGFIDIGTDRQDPTMEGMIYAFSGYVEKTGTQDIYLRPVNKQVLPLSDPKETMWSNSFSYIYDNTTNSTLGSFSNSRGMQPFNIDKIVAETSLKAYNATLNPTAEAFFKTLSFAPFTAITPVSGIDVKIEVAIGTIGLYSYKGTANGLTLESNQGVYDWNTKSVDFKLYGTPTQGGTIVFPMYNVITGVSAGSISITTRKFE
ncbi:hypothetical protein [Flavobacterium sp. C3NV]|uniref:hypothetical protein n=1 Tax=Flavobacterium sp. C3NV TaxID=3393358 RepID=UPI00398F9792